MLVCGGCCARCDRLKKTMCCGDVMYRSILQGDADDAVACKCIVRSLVWLLCCRAHSLKAAMRSEVGDEDVGGCDVP